MDLSNLRSLVREVNFGTHGVAATITVPGAPPVPATVIWLTPVSELRPEGQFPRTEARRSLAVRRDEIPAIPRQTRIEVAEHLLETPTCWLVDSAEAIFGDHYRVTVVAEA